MTPPRSEVTMDETTPTKCTHARTRKLGTRQHFGAPCERTGVPAGSYTVVRCTRCRERFDVDAVTGRAYGYTPENLQERAAERPHDIAVNRDRDVYTPTFDGVDAVEDTRHASSGGHFDARGGVDGIGDAGVFSC